MLAGKRERSMALVFVCGLMTVWMIACVIALALCRTAAEGDRDCLEPDEVSDVGGEPGAVSPV